MIVNRELYKHLNVDMYTYSLVFDELRKKWPQLNETTRLEYVDRPKMFIERLGRVSYFDDLVRVSVSGWRRLKAWLFPSRYLIPDWDNPVQRWHYSVNLWRAIIHAPMPLFWRTAGRIFKRQDWYNRGTAMEPNPAGRIVLPAPDVVDLEAFGWRLPYGEEGRIYCGYYAPKDILFIRKR